MHVSKINEKEATILKGIFSTEKDFISFYFLDYI